MKFSKKVFSLVLAALVVVSLFACSNSSAAVPSADLVVCGKIFTSESNEIVEAFAVKDGKYIYVGDRKGAEAFVEEGKTEVVERDSLCQAAETDTHIILWVMAQNQPERLLIGKTALTSF